MIDEITEKLINLYLKYSDSKSISVDEFIRLRECAKEEYGNISYSSCSAKQDLKVSDNTKMPSTQKTTNKAKAKQDDIDILSILKSVED